MDAAAALPLGLLPRVGLLRTDQSSLCAAVDVSSQQGSSSNCCQGRSACRPTACPTYPSHVSHPIHRVHHPAINDAVQLVHEALAACRIQPYDEASGTGQLRYLQLTAVEEAPGSGQPAAVQLVLVWNCQPGDSGQGRRLQAFADHLWQAGQLRFDGTRLLHSIW